LIWGTIFGSNTFNGIFIMAAAAITHPITVSWQEAYNAFVLVIWPWWLFILHANDSLNKDGRICCCCHMRSILLLSCNAKYIVAKTAIETYFHQLRKKGENNERMYNQIVFHWRGKRINDFTPWRLRSEECFNRAD
jgi:Ca2+/Na+ antiporter